MMTMGSSAWQELDDMSPASAGQASPKSVPVAYPPGAVSAGLVHVGVKDEKLKGDGFILALVNSESGMKDGRSLLSHLQSSFDVGTGAAYSLFGPEGDHDISWTIQSAETMTICFLFTSCDHCIIISRVSSR